MSEIVSVYAIFGNAEEAYRIGRAVVDERLAACVNILGACRSIYRWEGEVEETEEIAAIFKTGAGRAAELIARIREMHSYDLPAAVVWPIADTLADYRSWVAESSGG